jgi:hypothetical protein
MFMKQEQMWMPGQSGAIVALEASVAPVLRWVVPDTISIAEGMAGSPAAASTITTR